MYITKEFLQVKKDKDLNAIVLLEKGGVGTIRLCLQISNKYNNEVQNVSKEFPIIVNYVEYSKMSGYDTVNRELLHTCFYMPALSCNGATKTFLRAIKSEQTNLRFEVVINNSSNYLLDAHLTRHELFGLVNDDRYLLEVYVGRQNSGSPVQF